MKSEKVKKIKRRLRHGKIRARVSGAAVRPRLSVFRSHTHIYAQLIDDVSGKTLLSFSSLKVPGKKGLDKKVIAEKVGEGLGKAAVEKGIKRAAFDRGGYAYHGRVQALAKGARKAGLEF